MNRRQRRAMAREASSRAGLKGREKQQSSSRIARTLPGGIDHVFETAKPRLETPAQRQLIQRESGLVVPTNG